MNPGKLNVRPNHSFGVVDPDTAAQMAPTDIGSLVQQCHQVGVQANALFDQLGLACFKLTTGTSVPKPELGTLMENLEDLASLALQLRNSFATHLFQDPE